MLNHGKQLVLTCAFILHTVNQSINYTKQVNRRDDKIQTKQQYISQTKIENGSLIHGELIIKLET